ncbi:MAG TPA: hypothetical protein VGU43_04595 [Thermoplasmata archaeon]|nr:hypothetical protein [Thermoplasmata archaeon]
MVPKEHRGYAATEGEGNGSAQNTTIRLRRETVEELRPLKQKGFGAEETWDHFIRRVTGLPELELSDGVPA